MWFPLRILDAQELKGTEKFIKFETLLASAKNLDYKRCMAWVQVERIKITIWFFSLISHISKSLKESLSSSGGQHWHRPKKLFVWHW